MPLVIQVRAHCALQPLIGSVTDAQGSVQAAHLDKVETPSLTMIPWLVHRLAPLMFTVTGSACVAGISSLPVSYGTLRPHAGK